MAFIDLHEGILEEFVSRQAYARFGDFQHEGQRILEQQAAIEKERVKLARRKCESTPRGREVVRLRKARHRERARLAKLAAQAAVAA